MTYIQTHENLRSPNCGRHAVLVVDKVNNFWQRSNVSGIFEFLMEKRVFGFPGSTSGSNLIKLGLL